MEEFKTKQYKKNNNLEWLLKELNANIASDLVNGSQQKYPILFIVGTPRSGTTILTQWLASLDLFCFPTNFVSRFYANPYVGYLIQEMLYNSQYTYKDELQLEISGQSFKSDIGKTTGPLEPHEFWYFWRSHFKFPEIPVENDEFIQTANFERFIHQISRIQEYFNKPFFIKSLIMNWYIESFYKNIPNSIFLYIKRDPLDNMQSLLDVRKRYLGDDELWFSFKPKEYLRIKNESKYMQVAGQVEYTNREIEMQLAKIPDSNKIQIDYRSFCEDPEIIYQQIRTCLGRMGMDIPDKSPSLKNFSHTLSVREYNEELIRSHELVLQLLK